jgi:membrane protease subunit HflC
VISSDQQRLEVDAYARFRIIDPVRMVRTAGSTDRVAEQLQPILTSVLRQGLASHTFQSLLTAERGAMMAQIRTALDTEAREYGAQVIDVRIKHADLPDGTPLDRAFARMEAAREQEATTIMAQGQKQAQIIRGEAEASAARTYAEAYGKDPPSTISTARWRAIAPLHQPRQQGADHAGDHTGQRLPAAIQGAKSP